MARQSPKLLTFFPWGIIRTKKATTIFGFIVIRAIGMHLETMTISNEDVETMAKLKSGLRISHLG